MRFVRGIRSGGGASSKKIALNQTSFESFGPTHYLINLFNEAANNFSFSEPSHTTPWDAHGYFVNMPSGDNCFLSLKNIPNVDATHIIKTGQYVLKWSGAAFTVAITGEQITAFSSAANRVVVNIAQPPAGTTHSITVRFTNSTGSAASITPGTLVFCHVNHEAAWDAGERWNPDYIAWAGTGLKYIRCMKPLLIENSAVTTAAGIRTEADLFWNDAGPGFLGTQATTTGLPYTQLVKLGKKLNCDVFCDIPIGLDDTAMAFAASQVYSAMDVGGGTFTGNLYPVAGNENWNQSYLGPDGSQTIVWLAGAYCTLHGLTPNVGNSRGSAEAHCNLRWWKALLTAGVPRNRIYFSASFQTADGWGLGGPADNIMKYVDTTNIIGTGGTQAFWQLLDNMFHAPYTTPQTAVDTTGASAIYHLACYAIDWKNLTDAQMDTYYDQGTGFISFKCDQMYAYLTALGRGTPITINTYEYGQSLAIQGIGFTGTCVLCSVNATSNTLQWDQGTTYALTNATDGDALYSYYNQNPTNPRPAPGISMNNGIPYYVRFVDATHSRIYTTKAAAIASYANDALAKAASILLDTPTPTDQFWFSNATRVLECGQRATTYLDGAAGLAMYQRFFAAMIGTGKTAAANQLCDQGDYFINEFGNTHWGLQGSFYGTATLRATWFLSQ